MKHAHLLLLIRAHFILGASIYDVCTEGRGGGSKKCVDKDEQFKDRVEKGSINLKFWWTSYLEIPFKKISRRHAKFPHCLYAVLLSLSFSLSFHLNKEFRNFSPLPSSFRAPRDDRDSFKWQWHSPPSSGGLRRRRRRATATDNLRPNVSRFVASVKSRH